ncbi:MAG: hypothetical protein HY328_02640 [Chloroflexi bacterium]|nr:hypothetical protein [Chloroflexota bacterium]
MLLSLLAYALALWLGPFLLVRDGARAAPRLAGQGLLVALSRPLPENAPWRELFDPFTLSSS